MSRPHKRKPLERGIENMMKQVRYTAEQKEWAIEQMMVPINRAVVELAKATGITTTTLRVWQKEARAEGRIVPGDSKSSDQWNSADKFKIVLEAASLSETELSAYCRRRGLYVEQIREWRLACEQANEPLVQTRPSASQTRRINELERALLKQGNRLAESEALLELRKKAEAIWGKAKEE